MMKECFIKFVINQELIVRYLPEEDAKYHTRPYINLDIFYMNAVIFKDLQELIIRILEMNILD